jgi:hypothetical protein
MDKKGHGSFFPERRRPLSVIRPSALHFREAGRLVSTKEKKNKGGGEEKISGVKGS